jgi:uncharacterized protein Yka (UPF0111/DUF47 family)
MKTRIVEQLGESEILMPSRIAEGLAANDRAKVRMSALQAAARHAADPTSDPDDLSAESAAAGVDAAEIRSILTAARAPASGKVGAPGLGKLISGLLDDLDTMIEAVGAGGEASASTATNRLAALKARIGTQGDEIEASRVAEISAIPDDGDSVHRLVMDLHKVLNRLSAACAEETIAGAHAHGVLPADRPIIEAFMGGVARTKALKFNHPGLDTTVMRSGARLVIQNDIGATDAHVLVVTVDGLAVTITYTDVHRARAKFFVALFDRFPVQWTGLNRESAKGLGDDDSFYLVTGRYQADNEKSRNPFLDAIGASLVFLIDWNKARKSLRALVDGQSAVRILDWAARNDIGHRAYLECGGNELVATAIRRAAPARIGFGDELVAVLGHDNAVDFLKTVLRTAMESLRDGRSSRLLREVIETELVRHLDRTDSAMVLVVLRQLGLARDIAVAISGHLAAHPSVNAVGESAQNGAPLAERARRIEEKADRIAVDARVAVRRLNASPIIAQLVDAAEDTVDELEQAAFLASLMPTALDATFVPPLATLADAATRGIEAAVSGIDAAGEVSEGRRSDVDDAFDATRVLIDLEHAADNAERIVTGLVLSNDGAKGALCVLELARAMERSTDRLARIGHLIHEHVMADLSA